MATDARHAVMFDLKVTTWDLFGSAANAMAGRMATASIRNASFFIMSVPPDAGRNVSYLVA
jgi:hypothetical protein